MVLLLIFREEVILGRLDPCLVFQIYFLSCPWRSTEHKLCARQFAGLLLHSKTDPADKLHEKCYEHLIEMFLY